MRRRMAGRLTEDVIAAGGEAKEEEEDERW